MVWMGTGTAQQIDFSFIATLNCNLTCPFCQYSCSPQATDTMNFERIAAFIATIDYSRINAFGFYGGEPAVNTHTFSKVMGMVGRRRSRFLITNGTWSQDPRATEDFLYWALVQENLTVYVSGTAHHRRNQNLGVLQKYEDEGFRGHRGLILKAAETSFLPMGRLGHLPVHCTHRCTTDQRPGRMAAMPGGEVIWQTCDGQYPVVGHIREGFPVLANRVQEMREDGFHPVCPHFQKTESGELVSSGY